MDLLKKLFPPSKCSHNKGFEVKFKKGAFTLAEILAVLVILGVVATLTISTITTHYKKRYALTRLQMAYSLLSKVVEESIVENGPVSSWNFNRASGWGSNDASRRFAETYLIPGLSVEKTCEYMNSRTKCFYTSPADKRSDNRTVYNAFYITPDGTPPSTYNSPQGSYQLLLRNGMSIAVFVAHKNGYDNPNQVRINVDIDGPDKGKSVLGEDVFVFQIHKDRGLIPYHHQDYWEDNCMNANLNNGAQHHGGGRASCAYYIIQNGWKFPRNYPFYK